MQALIPQKDTLFLLSQLQKGFLSKNNSLFLSHNKQNSFFPQYPLWCFFDSSITRQFFEKHEVLSCSIEFPECYDEDLFFPLTLTCCENSASDKRIVLNGRIVFAKRELTDEEKIPSVDFSYFEKESVFPLKQRIFRIAEVDFSSNSWKIESECWEKCK